MRSYQMTMEIQHAKTAEFKEFFGSISLKIRGEKGCLQYHLFKDVRADLHVYRLDSEWDSKDAMNSHFQTLNFEVLLGAVSTLGRLSDFRVCGILEKGGAGLAKSKVDMAPV